MFSSVFDFLNLFTALQEFFAFLFGLFGLGTAAIVLLLMIASASGVA